MVTMVTTAVASASVRTMVVVMSSLGNAIVVWGGQVTRVTPLVQLENLVQTVYIRVTVRTVLYATR